MNVLISLFFLVCFMIHPWSIAGYANLDVGKCIDRMDTDEFVLRKRITIGTGINYRKVDIIDPDNQEKLTIILDNRVLLENAKFLFKIPEDIHESSSQDFIDSPIECRIEGLKHRLCSIYHVSNTDCDSFLLSKIIASKDQLSTFEVDSQESLIQKHFYFSPDECSGFLRPQYERYSDDPSFIGLILGMGFRVFHNGFTGVLSIEKR